MSCEQVTKARLAEKELRYKFEAEKEKEWAQVSARARVEVEDAVWEARRSGEKVSAIAAAYGTKDRRTIYDILKRREQDEKLLRGGGSTGTLTVSHDPIGDADGYPNPYRVEARDYVIGGEGGNITLNGWARIYFREPDRPKIADVSEIGGPLHNALLKWDDEKLVSDITAQVR